MEDWFSEQTTAAVPSFSADLDFSETSRDRLAQVLDGKIEEVETQIGAHQKKSETALHDFLLILHRFSEFFKKESHAREVEEQKKSEALTEAALQSLRNRNRFKNFLLNFLVSWAKI